MAAKPLPRDPNFLVLSRNGCVISTRTTQAFPNPNRNKNENENKIPSLISELKNRDVHIGGLACFSAVQLPAVFNSRRHLRTGGDRARFSAASLLPLLRSRSPSLWTRLMSLTGDEPSTNPQESAKTVRCVIKGRVQGVFYRNWTVENATQLGLKGWVRNRRDGSVEALFSGKPESVDEMQQRCRRGPPDAMVTGFQDFPCSDDPGTRFELKPTI